MVTYISHSPAETEALGEGWGRAAQPGLVLALSGELGAGKTQLVKGLARGLGITSRVQSPSFALVNIYSGGRLSLFHLDLYRLETREQIRGAGLEEYLRPDGVAVIEWAERWFEPPPKSEAPGTKHQAPSTKLQQPQSTPGVRPSSGAATTANPPAPEFHAPPQLVAAAPGDGRTPGAPVLFRWVRIESLSETERCITYEDSGA